MSHSDLDSEPDISIGEAGCSDIEEMEDTTENLLVQMDSKGRDISAGRKYRQPFQPKPVMAPVKNPQVSATVTSPGEDTDSNEKVDTVAAPKSPTPEGLSKDPPDMKNKGDSSTLNIDFEVKGGYKTTQSVKVSMNGEELMATSRLNSGPRFGDI